MASLSDKLTRACCKRFLDRAASIPEKERDHQTQCETFKNLRNCVEHIAEADCVRGGTSVS
ncbi:unnamed protein product, partial [Oppiella nova]